MPVITADTLSNIFAYHAPKGDQADRYQRIRAAGREMALLILNCTPASPEQTLAIRALQSAVMLANAAIATNE